MLFQESANAAQSLTEFLKTGHNVLTGSFLFTHVNIHLRREI
jgi:hypothetical protein